MIAAEKAELSTQPNIRTGIVKSCVIEERPIYSPNEANIENVAKKDEPAPATTKIASAINA